MLKAADWVIHLLFLLFLATGAARVVDIDEATIRISVLLLKKEERVYNYSSHG